MLHHKLYVLHHVCIVNSYALSFMHRVSILYPVHFIYHFINMIKRGSCRHPNFAFPSTNHDRRAKSSIEPACGSKGAGTRASARHHRNVLGNPSLRDNKAVRGRHFRMRWHVSRKFPDCGIRACQQKPTLRYENRSVARKSRKSSPPAADRSAAKWVRQHGNQETRHYQLSAMGGVPAGQPQIHLRPAADRSAAGSGQPI